MAKRFSTGLRNKLAGIKTNLVTNGYFETDTTGWTGVDATLSTDATGGVGDTQALQVANASATSGRAHTDVATVVGGVYLLSLSVDSGDAGSLTVMVGSDTDEDAILTSPAYTDTSMTEKKLAFVATATSTRITVLNGSSTAAQFVLVDQVVCEEVLDGMAGIFQGGKINLYSGSQPTSPDDGATGTLICTISKDAGSEGFTFTSAASGAIGKPSGDVWEGINAVSGTIGWGRLYDATDTPTNSSSESARYDFSVGTSGADVNMSSVSASALAKTTIATFTLTAPASA